MINMKRWITEIVILGVLFASVGYAAHEIKFSGLKITDLTASRVVQTNASKILESSSVTPTELGYLSGATGTTGSGKLVYHTNPTLAGLTMSSTIACGDNLLTRPVIKDYGEKKVAIGSDTTPTVDLTNGNVFTDTIDTGETTYTFSNPPSSGTAGSFTLILTNGGSRTVNWPASVKWAGGTSPELTSSGVDVLTFITIDGGTTWYGFVGGLDMS